MQKTVGILSLIQPHPARMAGCLVHGKEYEGSLGFDFFMALLCGTCSVTSNASQLNTIEDQGSSETANRDGTSENAEQGTRKRATA